ncbi:hypothetical protein EVAR_65299_1 [Eumeta japonica]|uniref:Uncharacterized protein n=1 Tax=Eumeta variegata TaxID=151549 RepID=A0A4C2AED5_EUMVA|nr:hypothetical protein EVAR_65299_1 [Eumeta japonica]
MRYPLHQRTALGTDGVGRNQESPEFRAVLVLPQTNARIDVSHQNGDVDVLRSYEANYTVLTMMCVSLCVRVRVCVVLACMRADVRTGGRALAYVSVVATADELRINCLHNLFANARIHHRRTLGPSSVTSHSLPARQKEKDSR